ncbi:MAG: hypothetical protein ACJAWQ_000535 [Paraglaciecola sp.]|jgi:hypothetical protein
MSISTDMWDMWVNTSWISFFFVFQMLLSQYKLLVDNLPRLITVLYKITSKDKYAPKTFRYHQRYFIIIELR